jgi:RimJ/RimL family protein N-acetyltransferase
MRRGVTMRPLGSADEGALAELFLANDVPEVTRWFDPFPLTADTARALTHRDGRDLYWGVWEADALVGLAMVRGWDGGHPEPASGCLVDRGRHGEGIGTALSLLVLDELERRGVREVRARVHDDNEASLRMHLRAGYQVVAREPGRVLLRADPASPR